MAGEGTSRTQLREMVEAGLMASTSTAPVYGMELSSHVSRSLPSGQRAGNSIYAGSRSVNQSLHHSPTGCR
jgi:hypothetical protein